MVATFGLVHILSNLFRLSLGGDNSDLNLSQLVEQYHSNYGWVLRLTINCFGYSCIFIPGYFIYKYAKTTKYLERTDRSFIPAAVRFCFSGVESEHLAPNVKKEQPAGINWKECGRLTYCFVGLMISYLTWGVLQEKIMTKEYITLDKKKVFFRDSQFLVFANRVLAFIIAGIYLLAKRQTRQKVPLFKYSFASFSNIMSAWFQYEALKFVNFPTQVLAKSCKIIPVMLMGKIISKSKYETYEYLTAGLISVGMIFFLTGSTDESKASSVTTLTGVVLLILYMVFDSFTSNWQGDLFKKYSMSPIQMMCGVNLFSTLFTTTSLLIQGGFLNSIEFASEVRGLIVVIFIFFNYVLFVFVAPCVCCGLYCSFN